MNAPGWKAAPLTVVDIRGRKFVAIDDIVTVFRDMTAALEDGPVRDSLTTIADSFAKATDTAGPPSTDDGSGIRARRCDTCRAPVIDARTDTAGGTVTVDANHARYGDWMVLKVEAGVVTVVKWDHGRHDGAFDNVVRLRTHTCPPRGDRG